MGERQCASCCGERDDEDELEEEAPFWALGGKGPSEADTTLFGFIAAAMVCDA